ncbi:hypothetical protein DB88DRAFT_479000 [Papiliotrema laurentii]|uniref:Rad51-like C-terminal domain-containing protein n=1 Tax=Papiliotrema laurentii TaxID=5418 RepID=A0AAD9L9R4_PAPLA|nr:hypothetical protein DB88DRAFT_479000 [Papiliotrema laurentii]
MLLKRLAGVLPPHLARYIPVLEEHNVKTTENLLFTSRQHLDVLLTTIPKAVLDELVMWVVRLTAPNALSGDEALDQLGTPDEDARWEGWGVNGLDSLFGWDGVGVMEISGARRVGKSLLALQAAMRIMVAHPQVTCQWVDTEGSFSPARARKVVEGLHVQDVDAVLCRLVIIPCFQVEPDLFDIVGTIKAGLEGAEPADGSGLRTAVLVIDPIVNLFRDTLTSTTAQGHAAMVTVMEEIAEMTYEHHLLTIIVNTSSSSLPGNPLSSFSATTTKPSLGAAFTYHADISLFVQETGRVFGMVDQTERERTRTEPGMRALVEVLKSRVSPAGRWAVFETKDGVGLLDVVPPETEDERTLRLSAGMPVGPVRPVHGPLAETVVP